MARIYEASTAVLQGVASLMQAVDTSHILCITVTVTWLNT